jgi:hypothetical protein
MIKGIAPMSNTELRRQLQTIVDGNTGLHVGNQIKLIADLSRIYAHNIKLEAEAKINDDKSWRYNCFTYAFHLLESPEFLDITERYSFLFANSSFVSYLIAHHLFQTEQNLMKDNDYIIYFQNDEPTHAGRIRNDKVLSKWGHYHLWEHFIWEVPIEYGTSVRFFKQFPLEECVLAFKAWVDTSRSHA